MMYFVAVLGWTSLTLTELVINSAGLAAAQFVFQGCRCLLKLNLIFELLEFKLICKFLGVLFQLYGLVTGHHYALVHQRNTLLAE